MARRHMSVVLGALALLAAASSSCLDPTQVTLVVRTDVRCDATKGTRIASGTDSRTTERAEPAITTRRCEAGEIGTLVASPEKDKDGRVAFLVAMGIDVPDSECTAANEFKGCIVQRRALTYVAHTPLELPIAMLLVCKDKVCDVNSTCARSGKCVPSTIRDPERCASDDCYPEGDGPEPKPGEDGGPALDASGGDASDGGNADGGSGDGAPSDGSPPSDADSSVPPGRLYCPPVANGCARGDTCCWDKNGLQGSCASEVPCAPRHIPMKCNQRADCPAGEYCCAGVIVVITDPPTADMRVVQGSACTVAPSSLCAGSILCLQSSDCRAGSTCNENTTLFEPPGVFGECVAQ